MVDDIERIIGRMEAQHEESGKQRSRLFEKMETNEKTTQEALRVAQAAFDRATATDAHIAEHVDPFIKNVTKLKNWGYGALAGVAVLSYGLGNSTWKYIAAFFKP